MGGDVAHVQVLRLVGEIGVEVGVHAEGGGEREHDADVLEAVAVVVRATADQVGAHGEGPAQEALGAGRLDDAFLREGADLQIQRRCVLVAQRQDGLHPGQPHDGIHLDVRAHRRRPGPHGEVEHAAGPRPDIVHGERLLGLGAQLQRLRQRARRSPRRGR